MLTWGWGGRRWHLDLGLGGPGGARPGAARGWSPRVGLSFQAVLHPYALGSTARWLALVKKHLSQPPSPDIPCPQSPSSHSLPSTCLLRPALPILGGQRRRSERAQTQSPEGEPAVWPPRRPGGRCLLAGHCPLPPQLPGGPSGVAGLWLGHGSPGKENTGLGWSETASWRRLDLNWVNWARPHQRQQGPMLSLGHGQSSFHSLYP